MTVNKNIKIIVNYVAGPLIMGILLYTVRLQLFKQPEWKESLHRMLESATGKEQWKLFLMFCLMWLNWAIETAKWRIALRPVQQIGFLKAYKAIFAGTCIASFTPNRVGDYLGRMLYINPGNKVVSIAPSVLCSMSQMLVTLCAGTSGIYYYARLPVIVPANGLSLVIITPLLLGTCIAALLLAMVYFRFDPLVRRLNKWLLKKNKTFTIPNHFSFRDLLFILLLSIFRYLVFLVQYGLLFSLFGITLSLLQVFTGVSVMFVFMALVPTLTFLTDLGVRWMVGIQVFQVFTLNTAGILAVSLGIWIINLIFPALIGSLLILRIKLFSSK